MKDDYRLLLGPLAAIVLLLGIAALPLMVPGYDAARQTVSEIGEAGSPAQVPFAVLLCIVAACLLGFSVEFVRRSSIGAQSRWPGYLTFSIAASVAGVGVFAFPNPLHNIFGMSEVLGYQAPLVLALTWHRHPDQRRIVAFSGSMAAIIWVMIVLNLLSLDRDGTVWMHVSPYYGLIQRGLFAAWFAWCAGAGLILLGMRRRGTFPA